ncbi:MAG: hypothetical protein AABX08_04175 [Nanoarchaeota archaeon]
MAYKKEALNKAILDYLHSIRKSCYSRPLAENEARNDELRPGYLIVTGFDSANPLHTRNISNGSKHSLVGHQLNGDLRYLLESKLTYKDGAILISEDGQLHRIGARLLNLKSPNAIARELGLQILDNESETFGFTSEVNTRHINALYASHLMPGTIVITMSGKTGDIRMYEKGRIIDSTVEGEPKKSLEAIVRNPY